MKKFLVEVDPTGLDEDELNWHTELLEEGVLPGAAVILADTEEEAFAIASNRIGVQFDQTYLVSEISTSVSVALVLERVTKRL